MLELDAVQTLAFAGLALFLGYALCRVVPLFNRYNLPAPVIGGLVVALAVLVARSREVTLFTLDTSLQAPLMIAFFTTIGVNASVALLKLSGRQVLVFLLLASGFAVVQNLVGIAVATAFGLNPMFGVLAGSATLTGGPATGLAFAPMFEAAGLQGAESIAVTAAMAGIVCGGVIGGPAITVLMRRFGVVNRNTGNDPGTEVADLVAGRVEHHETDADREFNALKAIVVLLLAMWAGSWLGQGFQALGLTLPAYIGAMLVGALVRNIDDFTGWLRLPTHTVELIGNVCLALFLMWRVTRPIRALTAASTALAEGEVDTEISGASRRDELGDLAAALAVFRDNTLKVRQMTDDEARRIHEDAFVRMKATEIHHNPDSGFQGAGHVIGTTRMGRDARTSVVDADLRAHDHRNLFLVGSGVFPTSGAANPTLTIAALALRSVDVIKQSLTA